jgi:hypothetical protein
VRSPSSLLLFFFYLLLVSEHRNPF